jgi:uncharacterized protein YcnI
MIVRPRLFAPILAFAAASVLLAHVTVSPKESGAGAVQKYTLRVPNEKAVANVRIEVEFPSGAEVSAVDDQAGWKVDLKKDSAGKITGAAWVGSLDAKGIVDLSFSAKNPKEETKLVWKVVQVYKDGSKSDWTGPAGSKGPAPVTTIKP